MKALKNVFILVSGILALVPGFLILKTSLGVPPGDWEKLFFGVVEAAGCFAILLIYSNKNRIITKVGNRKTKYSLMFFLSFLVGLVIYILLYKECVKETTFARGFIPLFWSDELAGEIASAGGKKEFVEYWMTDGSRDIIEKTASFQLSLTVVVFLSVYVLTLVSLVSSFAIAGLPNPRNEERERDPKTIKIFLASSEELQADRREFEIFIGRENKRLNKEGIFLSVELWEDGPAAMSQTRLQDEYNKIVEQCDIFVILVFTKVGKFSAEEFATALDQFKKNGKPLVYTYFNVGDVSMDKLNKKESDSLFAFQQKLEELGHFKTDYKNIEDLKYQFRGQLDRVLGEQV